MVVLEDDPVVAWVFPELLPGDKVIVGYEVHKDLLSVSESSNHTLLASGSFGNGSPITGFSILDLDSFSFGLVVDFALVGLFGLIIFAYRHKIKRKFF